MIAINGRMGSNGEVPFGGVKRSVIKHIRHFIYKGQ